MNNNFSEKQIDDVFYFCSLIEFIARKTKNHRADVINYFSETDIEKQLFLAEVNHCLSFEQVSDELIGKYKISDGNFDSISFCKFSVPQFTDIGRVYQELVTSNCEKKEDLPLQIKQVFNSFISDAISDFNSNVYYSNPDYLRCSYKANKLLA